MAFRSLGEFLAALEATGDLLRVAGAGLPGPRDHRDHPTRRSGADGPALLFENVKGATMPVAMNVLGLAPTDRPRARSETLEEPAERIARLVRLAPRRGLGSDQGPRR